MSGKEHEQGQKRPAPDLDLITSSICASSPSFCNQGIEEAYGVGGYKKKKKHQVGNEKLEIPMNAFKRNVAMTNILTNRKKNVNTPKPKSPKSPKKQK